MFFLIICAYSLEETTISYTGSSTLFDITPGQYKITCYGAQGGEGNVNAEKTSQGGKGAKVSGEIHISKPTTLNFTIGGVGLSDPRGPASGGWPDGGNGGMDDSMLSNDGDDGAGAGGGSTSVTFSDGEAIHVILWAGAGSGGVINMNGCPGGGIGMITRPQKNGECIEESDEEVTARNKGSSGPKSPYFPGSGGGGGFKGGPAAEEGVFDENDAYMAMACGGSSYANTDLLTNIESESNANQGSGKCVIETIYKCDTSCSDCSSATVCTSCSGELLLTQQGKCVDKCPSGTFVSNKQCAPCDSQCATCSESALPCTSCRENDVMYEGKCFGECPERTYNDNGICKNCDFTCKRCHGLKDLLFIFYRLSLACQ